MIIRTGHSNIRYSHDAEAAYAALRTMREFGHVTDAQLQQAIEARQDFAAPYYTNDDCSEFVAPRELWSVPPWARRVDLFHLDYLEREMLEAFGFSCVLCAGPTPFDDLGRLFDHGVDSALHEYQSFLAPLLICKTCAQFGNALLGTWCAADALPRAIEGFIAHVTAAHQNRAAA